MNLHGSYCSLTIRKWQIGSEGVWTVTVFFLFKSVSENHVSFSFHNANLLPLISFFDYLSIFYISIVIYSIVWEVTFFFSGELYALPFCQHWHSFVGRKIFGCIWFLWKNIAQPSVQTCLQLLHTWAWLLKSCKGECYGDKISCKSEELKFIT